MANMILRNGEQAEPLTAFAEYGSPEKLARWAMSGLKLRDGGRLRMEVVRYGRQLRTSRDAVLRFVEAMTEAAIGGSDPAPVASPAQDRKRAEAAVAKLDAMLAK